MLADCGVGFGLLPITIDGAEGVARPAATGVRVERLQDISEADADAEGVDFLRHVPDADESLTAKQLYECLWESINGAGSWGANP